MPDNTSNTIQSYFIRDKVSIHLWERAFVFIVILVNSQILSGTATNPIGFKGIQELFYIFLLCFTILYLATQLRNYKIFKTDLIVFLLVAFPLIYSSIAAQIRFGQPFYFGIFEERRILAFLIYFPLIWALRKRIVSVHQIFVWVLATGLICALLSLLIASGLISPLNVKEVGVNAIREDRYGIGQLYISLAALVIFNRLSFSRVHTDLIIFLVLVIVLVAVVQTRQILLSFLIALFVLRGPMKLLMWSFPMLLIFALLGNSPAVLAIIEKYQILVLQMVSSEYLTESARALSIGVILNEIGDGRLFGSGALSLLWNGGFDSVYTTHFYLADVGVFGSLYKFGILSILVYITYYIMQIKLLIKIKDHAYFRLILAAWIQIFLMSPVSAPIEYRGYISGLLLALSVGCIIEVSNVKRSKFANSSGKI